MAEIILYHPRLANKGTRVVRDDSGIVTSHVFAPPLGLVAILRRLKDAGTRVRIIDWQVERDPHKILAQELRDCKIFGVSAITGAQITDGLIATKLAKTITPKVKTIWGGWHATQLPEQTLQNEFIDYVAVGAGEEAFPRLVDALEQKGEPPAGIWYKSGRLIVNNGKANPPEFNTLGFMPYDLLKMEAYLKYFNVLGVLDSQRHERRRGFAFVSQYGCPFACTFCEITALFGRRTYYSPATNALNELEHLVRHFGVEEVYFFSPEFFVNRKYASELCQGMIDRGLQISWGASTRVDSLLRAHKSGTLDLAIQSGCFHLNLGMEAVSPNIQKRIRKAEYTSQDSLEAARILYLKGISAQLNLICGWPFETREDLIVTEEIVAQIILTNPKAAIALNFWKPFPSVPAYDEALAAGYNPPTTLAAWGLADFTHKSCEVPWITKSQKLHIRRSLRYSSMHAMIQRLIGKNKAPSPLIEFMNYLIRLRRKTAIYNLPLELRLYRRIASEYARNLYRERNATESRPAIANPAGILSRPECVSTRQGVVSDPGA
jgi:anaerobic magnesium-protoporphyrin IX monomethyl ester cyclase